MRRKGPKIQERLPAQHLDAVAAEGKCIVRTPDGVVFVEGRPGHPYPAPGDVANLKIVHKKKQYREAVIEQLLTPSAVRSEPFCEHFGVCGGCKWQHIQYPEQLRFKHQQVVDHLERIAKVQLPPIRPTLAAEPTRYYRNKLEFTITHGRWKTTQEIQSGVSLDPRAVGFHVPGRFDKVLPIRHCHLQPDPSNAIRLAVADYMEQHGLTAYDMNDHHGFLRTLIIRTTTTGQTMVTLQVAEHRPDELHALLSHLRATFPQITSLNYILNQKKNDAYADLDVVHWDGLPYVEEVMDDGDRQPLTFRIGPKSFYQTNPQQAHALYRVARDWAGLTGRERVYDLYTGAGTIALYVARQAAEVVGIEYVATAVDDARANAQLNGIQNATFHAGDMKALLTDDFFAQHGRPDVVITDPPRAGMDEAVVRALLRAAPERIVYVSCNTATQARDLAWLDERYVVADVQPVDMFPHTHHVENVARLERRT